ncbi:MAG: glycosyltransferase [Flavobacteriales bacterium]|nr:glycosyltransferase [Flavobacteriales bacterium]
MILLITGTVALLFIAVQVYTLNALVFNEPESVPKMKDLPMISVLIAARDEEDRIVRCLEALDAQDYPKDRIEILIGDDRSSDRTYEIAEVFIRERPQFKLIRIVENLGKARGKANVLAHLAHKARGDYFLITDVDVCVPDSWASGMLNGFREETGIMSGTTMCTREGMMQAIDWLHFMGYIKAFANVGLSCTAVGNNMAVRRKAYWDTGGFENLEFSITEDYRLFQAVTSAGWGWNTLLNPETLGLALPIKGYFEILQQRKRWLIGARDLTLIWKLLLGLYALFTPALLIMLVLSPHLGLTVWFVKFTLQTAFISALCSKLKIKPFKIFTLVIYELFVLLNTLFSMIFFLMPVSTRWKGRVYRKDDLI